MTTQPPTSSPLTPIRRRLVAASAEIRIEAGSALDPKSGEYVELGLPYREKPCLVLIHLASEAIRTGSAIVDVGGSMTAFARALGMETNEQQIRALKSHLSTLAASSVRMGVVDHGRPARSTPRS